MRPDSLTPLFRDISGLAGVGAKLSGVLRRLCGPAAADILWHLPVGVIHRPYYADAAHIATEYGTIRMQITQHLPPPTKKQPYRILGLMGGSPAELVFFNYHQNYLDKYKPDDVVFVSGKIEKTYAGIKMLHPDFIVRDRAAIPEYEALYPLAAGVSQRLMAKLVAQIAPTLPALPEWLDGPFMKQRGLPDWKPAVVQAHHPKSAADILPLHPARLRLAYDELLANQLALLLVRAQEKRAGGLPVRGTGELVQQACAALPYELTHAQQRVIAEIEADLASDAKMVRLLQGDVGSGKTIVALLAALRVVESGAQVAFMAPTDILARQHEAVLSKLCTPLGVRVGLLTAREKGTRRDVLLQAVARGEIPILIGTHALFEEDVRFARLGLAVVDEQHKFGVYQRLALAQKQRGVNMLVMTATPIPRTLALTAYGDMDLSQLDEKPPGRTPIETRVMPVAKIPDLAARLKEACVRQKTQAYWVCPLVEESEKTDLIAAKARFAELQRIFGDRVGLVHGRMKGADKDAVMERFIAGELDILVATTVIEVGVDVKAATLMVVEHAERFGLSGLHQLRGRVGRGGGKSLCLLLYGETLSENARERLRVMRETDDGFVIAEADLKLRGAGELLGVRQSGYPDFKLADMSAHRDLLWTATQDARAFLTLDPDLKTSRGQALKILLYLFGKDRAIQTIKAG
ncbi:MAG: ATP-dependent DNA helicase RecG [Alphaproteobacteria bacterium]|nr:ATP-dependent DNA helicase RecG [Alphaproteobacteria bacterium]